MQKILMMATSDLQAREEGEAQFAPWPNSEDLTKVNALALLD